MYKKLLLIVSCAVVVVGLTSEVGFRDELSVCSRALSEQEDIVVSCRADNLEMSKGIAGCLDDLAKLEKAFKEKENQISALMKTVNLLTSELGNLTKAFNSEVETVREMRRELAHHEKDISFFLFVSIFLVLIGYKVWWFLLISLFNGLWVVVKFVSVVLIYDNLLRASIKIRRAYNYCRRDMVRDVRVAYEKRFKSTIRNEEEIPLSGLENCDEERRHLLSDPIQAPIISMRPTVSGSGSSEIVFEKMERYTAEAVLSYSPLIPIKNYPKCIVKIFSISDEDASRLTAVGLGFWVGDFLITASHLLRVANTREVAVFNANNMDNRQDLMIKDFYRLDEIDVAAIKMTPLISAKLKITKARAPAHSVLSKVTIQAYGITHTSNGYIKRRDEQLGHLWFDGSSKGGFSGSPYMVGENLVYGMHQGSTQTMGFGIEISLLLAALEHQVIKMDVNHITLEASEDFVIDEILKTKGKGIEYSRGIDEYIIRLNSKFFLVDNEYIDNHPLVGKYLRNQVDLIRDDEQRPSYYDKLGYNLENYKDVESPPKSVQGNLESQPSDVLVSGKNTDVESVLIDKLLKLVEQKLSTFQEQLEKRMVGPTQTLAQQKEVSDDMSTSSMSGGSKGGSPRSKRRVWFERRLQSYLKENGLPSPKIV